MRITQPSKSAAGLKAVFHSMRMAFKSMSPIKTGKVLAPLNQKGGTDCPGCAWPDPDHRSNLGEFCENGVKAIAEEATDRSVDASFFSKAGCLVRRTLSRSAFHGVSLGFQRCKSV